jgi:hypothetical protein
MCLSTTITFSFLSIVAGRVAAGGPGVYAYTCFGCTYMLSSLLEI